MNKKKQETKQTSQQSFNNTNTFGYMTPPDTKDIQAIRDFQFKADPRIGYSYANARNQAANSFQNPLGGMYSPQMRDSILRATTSDLAQREAQAYSEANQQLQGQQYSQRALVAGLTNPQMVQTGSSGVGSSSGTGTTTQSGGLLGDLLLTVAAGSGQGTGAAA